MNLSNTLRFISSADTLLNRGKINSRHRRIAFLILLMAVGYALRLHLMLGQYYNSDEILHLQIAAGKTLLKVLEYARFETHPPLGHIIRHYWMMGGDSPTYQRHLSIVFGLACIPVIYGLGKETAGRQTGLIATTLLTFVHHTVLLSAVVRNYTMGTLFILLTLLFLLRFHESRKIKYALLYLVFGSCAVLTLYLNILILFCFTVPLFFILLARKDYKPALVMGICSFIPAMLGVVSYGMQYHYFIKYINISHANALQLAASIGPFRQALADILSALLIIPNTLIALDTTYIEDRVLQSATPLLACSFILCITLPFYKTFGITLLQDEALRKRAYFFLVSSLLILPLIAFSTHYYGSSYLTSLRRLSILSIPFVVLYAILLSQLGRYLRMAVLSLCLATGFLLNMNAEEFPLREQTRQKLEAFSIAETLGTKNYIAFASPGSAFYFMPQDFNYYDILNSEARQGAPLPVQDAYFLYQDGPLYYRAFAFGETTEVTDRSSNPWAKLVTITEKHRVEKPWFVFAVPRWDIHVSPKLNQIRSCFAQRTDTRILFDEPLYRRDISQLEMLIFAVPYDTAYRYFKSGEIKCQK